MVDLFPAARQTQARRSLAGTLPGVTSQRLVRRADGSGRVPSRRSCSSTAVSPTSSSNPAGPTASPTSSREGDGYAIRTCDQSLLELARGGVVTVEDIEVAVTNRHDFLLALANGGYSVAASLDGS